MSGKITVRRFLLTNDYTTLEHIGDIENLLVQLAPVGATRKKLSALDIFSFQTIGDHVFIVAEDTATRKIVGMATLRLKPLLGRGLVGEVEEFVVDEAYRGQGIAGRIHDEIVVAAKEHGVHELRLTSAPWRVIANEFYKKRGYVPYDTNVYRRALP
ncbi:MAG: hypothetical protein A3J08_03370 [Candidatus Lloydbacteria bacterium RIFCSPLOWO2_02_FULL_51_11]|uniref:N-acetyltransferase domain-containing protein n=1 Tax=Candidatus Lloydbacteria bacterium RIFCSPLOWO2_02_FULL_51_11 TaxID=1798667 RepID=A0A1G2DLV1_9BACT|nr:MAG: hypothetical protein A3J08_03370 [Candidatus Lloydbacteria bacterium RIFCSPLOWO2_02_FULL_51_11]